jgi:aryl-alcohol dehydrogenase-like predicted oxidoreductase
MAEVLRTGLAVPLAAGCWSWGESKVWGYPDQFDARTLARTFDVLVDGGVRYFDTAEVYGRGESERIIGRLRSRASTPVVVSSKFYPFPWRLTRSQFLSALMRSVERLGGEPIAAYQIHHDVPWMLMSRWVRYLSSARHEGLIESIGASNPSLTSLRRISDLLARSGQRLDVVQSRYNLVDRRVERNGVLDFCISTGIPLLAHSPLSQGLLGGNYGPNSPPPGRRGRAISSRALEQVEIVLRFLRRIADQLDTSVAAVSLAWLRHKGVVPLVGTRDPAHAVMITGAVSLEIPPSTVDALDTLTKPWAMTS